MSSWDDVLRVQPDFARRVRDTFAVRKHATLATVRRDGSPRISGTEVEFDDDAGELYLGMMPGSVKAADLAREPRLAIHCPTVDPPESDPSGWLGDGKVAGTAVDVTELSARDRALRFRVQITEVVLTFVGTPADHLVVQSWHPTRGLEVVERR
jgi:Pyridoxamine 5'-phosphate oxidase